MADVQIVAGGASTAPLDYIVPGAQEIVLKTLYAEFDGSGATVAWLPTVEIIAPGGKRSGQYRTQDTVPAGDSAHVTWGPFLAKKGTTVTNPRNLGELGMSGSGTLGTTFTHTILYEDVQVGDGILVAVNAPILPSAAAPFGFPLSVTDSAGNTYANVNLSFWEQSPPNVNEGVVQYWFWCASSVAVLTAGVSTITGTWDNPVFDRSILAWLVRHDGGATAPVLLDNTPDGSPAVYAATQVTLTSPDYTPARDNTLFFALVTAVKAGGLSGFGAAAGYVGYLTVIFRIFIGSKQQYWFLQATHGANALVIHEQLSPQYEIDLGQLPAGVATGTFNGVGVNFTLGANAYKGIALWAID